MNTRFTRFLIARRVLPSLAVVASCLAPPSSTAAPRAVPRPAMSGSSIELEFSIKPDVLRPGLTVPLLACVSNQNPHSKREIEPGDSFRFEFTRGVVGDCLDVKVSLPASPFNEADFTCSVDSNVLTISYTGAPVDWTPGDAACASITYTPADSPTTVLTRAEPGTVGALAPGQAASLLLGVAPDLGIPGPAGPEGPAGPQGPPGGGAIGARHFSTSTGFVEVGTGDPPALIPGLEATLDLRDSSNLLVMLDVSAWFCAPAIGASAIVHVELDGVIVAARYIESDLDKANNATLVYLSGPLPAGRHVVRGLAAADGRSPTIGSPVRCIGTSALPRHPGTARLLALEVLP